MKKKKNGDWYFSEENFKKSELIQNWNNYLKDNKYLFRTIEGLSSPIKSYLSFVFGFQNKYDFTMKSAIDVIDLRHIPKPIRESYGSAVAFIMYKVLLSKDISFTAISANPEYKFPQFLYVSPKYGSIYLERILIDKKANQYKWLFPRENIQTALNIYHSAIQPPSQYDKVITYFIVSLYTILPVPEYYFLSIEYCDWIYFIFVFFIVYYICFFLKKIIFFVITPSVLNKNYPSYSKHTAGFSISAALLISILLLKYLVGQVSVLYLQLYIYSFYFFTFVTTLLLIILLCKLVSMIASIFLDSYNRKGPENYRANFVIEILQSLICILIVIVLTGMFMSQMGINMLSFTAALGIVVLAVSLAGKDTIENLFGSIVLIIESPFKIGDWIIIGNKEGDVEHIGLRSTRIRTFEDSALTIPNIKFITVPVDNMGARKFRRFDTFFDVEINTPGSMLKTFVKGIDTIVKDTPTMRKEGYHIRVNDIGESSIKILIYVFFIAPDWDIELQERETFILNVLQLAEKMNIKIAYPTRTIHFTNENDSTSYDMTLKQLNKETAHAKKAAKKIVNKSLSE